MRVAFLGNDRWSVPTLDALAVAADVDVELVLTNPPRPAGRGATMTPTAVAGAASRLGLRLEEAADLRPGGTALAALSRAEPEAMVVVAYGGLLPPAALAIPPLGTLNVHFSLLPRWRGAAPVRWAILEGDDVTGVSVMVLDEGLDTGPVLGRLEEPIAPDDDTESLGSRLAGLGAPFLVERLRAVRDGTASPRAQDPSGATYAAKLSAADRTIDWAEPAARLVRKIRALAPAPGATTSREDVPLKVLRAEAREAPAQDRSSAGSLSIDVAGVPVVTAGEGAVALLEVAPSGRARMSGAAWARGARLRAAERLT